MAQRPLTPWEFKNPSKTIEERFTAFHASNPQIYAALVEKARAAVARGYNKLSIALLVELILWDTAIKSNGKHQFKISNDFRAHYARDLAGFFHTRPLESL